MRKFWIYCDFILRTEQRYEQPQQTKKQQRLNKESENTADKGERQGQDVPEPSKDVKQNEAEKLDDDHYRHYYQYYSKHLI